MPNWCSGNLVIRADEKTVEKILTAVQGENTPFDFEKVVPMPESIFRGNLGRRELELYGKNNWYDWALENWGTKWNLEYAEVYGNCISFETAWSPCSPVISALAKQFPEAEFYYTYEEPGMCFCGAEEYREGKLVYLMEGDLEEYYYDDDDELPYDDGLFPVTVDREYYYRELFVPYETNTDDNGQKCVGGRYYYRNYEDGRLTKRINGLGAYKGQEPKYWY